MKSSRSVPMFLLGSAALLAGCGQETHPTQETAPPQQYQNSYNTVEDCRKDWGNDDKDCKPATSSGSTARAGYVGPVYMWHHGAGYPTAVYPDGTSKAMPNSYIPRGAPTASTATTAISSSRIGGGAVARGGFGGSAHSISSAGG